MGTCGCGDMNPVAALRVAPDRIIVVDEYHGCNYCDTPTGYSIHVFTEKAAKTFHIEDIQDVIPDPEYGSRKDFILIGKDEMISAAQEFEQEEGRHVVKFPGDSYSNLADFMHDNGLRLIQAALQKRKPVSHQ